MFMSYFCAQPLNSLSSYKEECQLEGVLNRLRGEVRKKRLLLYPYFRDFDRVSTEFYVSFAVWSGMRDCCTNKFIINMYNLTIHVVVAATIVYRPELFIIVVKVRVCKRQTLFIEFC